MESIKIAVIGDGSVGKTSLLQRFVMNHFPGEYVPSLFDNYSCEVNIDQKIVTLTLWDTQQDLLASAPTELPSLAYYENDVILLLFSVVSPASYASVKDFWLEKVQSKCKNTPIILVGTKKDLKTCPVSLKRLNANGKAPICEEMGMKLAKEIGAVEYIEISALSGFHVKHLFDEATRVGLNRVHQQNSLLIPSQCNLQGKISRNNSSNGSNSNLFDQMLTFFGYSN